MCISAKYSTISWPILFRLDTLHALYIELILHPYISNNFEVTAFFVSQL